MQIKLHKPERRFTPSQSLRVLLVDEDWNFLGCAEHFLAMEPDVEVIGCASSAMEALDQASLLKPDVIVMNAHMPLMNGTTTGRLLKSSSDAPRLILLDDSDSRHNHELKTNVADGVMPKSEIGARLLPMIRGMFAPTCA